jgi:adenosylcobinamide-GDP ribazoletransferase
LHSCHSWSLFIVIFIADTMLLPYALIVAETSAKQSMVTVAAFGRAIHKGFGSTTVDNTKKSDFIAGMAFSCAVCYLAFGISGAGALFISQFAGFLCSTQRTAIWRSSGDVVAPQMKWDALQL